MVIPSESSGPSFSCSQNALICEEGTTTSHIKTQLVPYVYMNKNKQQKLIKHYRILGTRLVLHWNDNDILMPKLFNTFFTSWFKKDHLKAWMCHLKMMRLASMLSRAVWLLPCQGINHHQNSKILQVFYETLFQITTRNWYRRTRGHCVQDGLVMINDRGKPAVSYRWTGWVWEITGWSSRLQGNHRSF